MGMKQLPMLIQIVIFILLFPMMIYAWSYDATDALDDLQGFASGLNTLVKDNLGSMSYLGEPIGYSFIKRLALGVGAGAIFFPVKNIDIGDASDSIDYGLLTFGYLPIPSAAAYGRFNFDVVEFGLKVGGIPEMEFKNAGVKGKNLVIGGNLRYKLVDYSHFALKGGASVGGLFEYAKGGITLRKGQPLLITDPDTGEVAGYLNTDSAMETSWEAYTVGGEIQTNIQPLFLNFFIGIRASKTFGTAKSKLISRYEIEPETGYESNFGTPVGTADIDIESKPEKMDVFGFGGVEAKFLMFVVSFKGSYNLMNQSFVLDGGGRLQF
jgi:hypothetical protein